jgi:hypothetical protein
VDESKYFEAIAKQAPDVDKGRRLGHRKNKLVKDFSTKWKENRQ